jgi:sodium/potassium/calcium exchanger 6
MSIIWIWFIADNLIALLKTIGLLMNIPDTFLGMTVLTFGNSLPDLVLNTRLVKNGYGEMALSGCIGGPFFNLLIGLGSSLLKLNVLYGKFPINFFQKENIISVIAAFTLIINLITLFVISYYTKYTLGNSISYIGFTIYGLFLLSICYITFLK